MGILLACALPIVFIGGLMLGSISLRISSSAQRKGRMSSSTYWRFAGVSGGLAVAVGAILLLTHTPSGPDALMFHVGGGATVLAASPGIALCCGLFAFSSPPSRLEPDDEALLIATDVIEHGDG